jgi:hypothetical protein
LSVVIVDHRCVDSLLLLKILASTGATLLSPCYHLPTLSALALSSIPLCSRSLIYLIVAAVASTAASVVVVFTPAPPWETAVRRVALAPSFSVAVVRIFSLSAASPSRPRIFATVASPLPLLLV